VAVKRNLIFHTAAATNGKVSAEKTFVAEILLIPGKSPLFTAGGKFLYRRFKNVAQQPFRLDKKIAGKAVAGMLDNNVTAALFIKCANRMFACSAMGQYRIKVTNA